jgi:sugar phosphate isomerase/epimerase
MGGWPYIDEVDWADGARHRVPIPEPLELKLKPLNPRSSDHGPEMPEYFKGQIPLFRDDLIEAMRSAGVDNLDLYKVRILDPDSGRSHENYKAVNIIGVVAAADMGKSKATVHTGGPVIDVEFDKLVVDDGKPRGALIFRLAEATGTILVHERLRDHLLAKGYDKLEFLEPGEVAV